MQTEYRKEIRQIETPKYIESLGRLLRTNRMKPADIRKELTEMLARRGEIWAKIKAKTFFKAHPEKFRGIGMTEKLARKIFEPDKKGH